LAFFGNVKIIDALATERIGNSARAQATEMHQMAISPVAVLETCPTQSLTFDLRARTAKRMFKSEIMPRAINR